MSAQELKERQRRHWDVVADGWAAWLDWTERNFSPLTEWLQQAAGWRPGARVLDIASGSGYPAFAAATRVRPGGSVVAVDLSSQMVALASRRAAVGGVENIEFLEMDAEDLRFDGGSFDAVTNTYGMMFCPDAARAVAEARRVLKPGGRFAVVTWDAPARSPFFAAIGEVAATRLSLPAPEPGTAGPFRFAAPDGLQELLAGAGFAQISVESRPMTFEFASSDEYCQAFGDLAWKLRMASLSETELIRFKRSVSEVAQPYVENGRLRLVATSLCAAGQKP